jgi:hypothetical protein
LRDVSDLRTCRCTVYARYSTQNGTHAIEIVVLSGAACALILLGWINRDQQAERGGTTAQMSRRRNIGTSYPY